MLHKLSYALELLANNVMFGIIFIMHVFVLSVWTVVSYLVAGYLCVDVWKMPVLFMELGVSQYTVYSILSTITVTILTKGVWFKFVKSVLTPWITARREHAEQIKHMFNKKDESLSWN